MTHRPKILNPVLNVLEAATQKTGTALCGKRVRMVDLTPTDFDCITCQRLHAEEDEALNDMADEIAATTAPPTRVKLPRT